MTITIPPSNYLDTRQAIHRLARYVVTPRREKVDGRERLTQLPLGFGTPPLGDDTQIRIEGAELVFRDGPHTWREEISSLRQAGALIGVEPDDRGAKPEIPQMGDIDEKLAVDTAAAEYLARWFEFAWAVLAAVSDDDESTNATETVLWSHHLDPALEILDGEAKASYGGSPGDGTFSEPYLYVAPWSGDSVPPDPYWNADGYVGSILPVAELATAEDSLQAGIDFMRRGRDLLAGR